MNQDDYSPLEDPEDDYNLFGEGAFSDEDADTDFEDASAGASVTFESGENVELRFIRYVHKPYKRPDKTAIATPRQRFDHTRAYRVLTVAADDSGVLSDISIPANVGSRDKVRTFNLVRLFYVGAEPDLDRYLRWLNNVALITDYGLPQELVVVEQLTSDLQSANFASLREDSDVMVLFPGELDKFGLLIGGKTRPGKRHRWHIY